MAKQYPILILIPHGGIAVPEELAGCEAVSDFDLFFQADTCANDLFHFGERVSATLDTRISRLFVDLDRSFQDFSPNGVIKSESLFGKKTFKSKAFPDEIAITNILKRYYFPFHSKAEKMLSAGKIKLAIECHTVMPVAPPVAHDAGSPRSTVAIDNAFDHKEAIISTCKDKLAQQFLELLEKDLSGKEHSIVPGALKTASPKSIMIRKYGTGSVPYLRLLISKSLFLNDAHFDHDDLRVDELKIKNLKEQVWESIDKWYQRLKRNA